MMTTFASRLLRRVIRIYQLLIRPILGPNCRFVPSCSEYALQAVALHGPVRGSALAVRRIVRCNPWCAGGHDPVPPNGDATLTRESPAAR